MKELNEMLPIACCVIGWATLYACLLRFNKSCTAEWNSRMIAFLHAFLISRSIEIFMLQFPFVFEEFGKENTSFHNNVLTFSISYFIFETCWCLYMQTEEMVMMLHHIVSLTGLLWCYQLNVCGYEVCLLIWCSEFTNPCLQTRWFLRTKEWHRALVAQINEFLFVCFFVLMRGVFGLCFIYQVINAKNLLMVMRGFGFAFQFVNCLFLYQIAMFAKKRLFGRYSTTPAEKDE